MKDSSVQLIERLLFNRIRELEEILKLFTGYAGEKEDKEMLEKAKAAMDDLSLTYRQD